MGWEIGFDTAWKRDIGYGVPAFCDHPGCGAEIDRGLGYVCGGDPYGGERGCGLFFCEKHQAYAKRRGRTVQLCSRCLRRRPPYSATPDHPEWIRHKLTDPSWGPWRAENPEQVAAMAEQLQVSADSGERTQQASTAAPLGVVPGGGK